jgi:hypothetical protein
VKNWRRRGDEDEMGALDLITPEKRPQGAACVVPGLEFEAVMDFVGVAFHGMATSHIDALCHVFVDGRMYDRFSKNEVKSTGRGAPTRPGSPVNPIAIL